MQENITNGFSSLLYDDPKMNDSFRDINDCIVGMDISNEPKPINKEKESFLTKYKKGKKPQRKDLRKPATLQYWIDKRSLENMIRL
ncbi:hypothetical protein CMU07_09205 [Elizabethkingia anophelis]|nr:hypothetical protein [Elizabethkingia anophelis]